MGNWEFYQMKLFVNMKMRSLSRKIIFELDHPPLVKLNEK
jgi:hypothetical protein